jgi:hypothetical protein
MMKKGVRRENEKMKIRAGQYQLGHEAMRV